MSFHLAAAPAKAIKVLPVLAAAMAFSLLPPAPSAGAADFTTVVRTTRAPTTGTIQLPPPPPRPDLTMGLVLISEAYNSDANGTFHAVLIRVWKLGNQQSAATQLLVAYQGRITRLPVPSLPFHAGWSASADIRMELYDEFRNPSCVLWVQVDPENLVSESNEHNNLRLKKNPWRDC